MVACVPMDSHFQCKGLLEDLFWDRVSPCDAGWPETCYVDQDGLELIEIHLPLLPECCD
ncbi:hypothetical protein I79_000019 [Cricetulus griseus]|uniref:Uncharacterized protein n=1 Tax=Cricetulus griseus TaxID=10029 RepID=G3GR76_CRIGR|nr:hypothetical protein I79_000019 [Cricetulus griseus]